MGDPVFTERARCVAIVRGYARAERNRAASYRRDRTLKAHEGEFMAFVAEQCAENLEGIAKEIESGAEPPRFAKGAHL